MYRSQSVKNGVHTRVRRVNCNGLVSLKCAQFFALSASQGSFSHFISLVAQTFIAERTKGAHTHNTDTRKDGANGDGEEMDIAGLKAAGCQSLAPWIHRTIPWPDIRIVR